MPQKFWLLFSRAFFRSWKKLHILQFVYSSDILNQRSKKFVPTVISRYAYNTRSTDSQLWLNEFDSFTETDSIFHVIEIPFFRSRKIPDVNEQNISISFPPYLLFSKVITSFRRFFFFFEKSSSLFPRKYSSLESALINPRDFELSKLKQSSIDLLSSWTPLWTWLEIYENNCQLVRSISSLRFGWKFVEFKFSKEQREIQFKKKRQHVSRLITI